MLATTSSGTVKIEEETVVPSLTTASIARIGKYFDITQCVYCSYVAVRW